jgi:membrane fusion protein (multidrug efflux system)
MRPIPSLVLVLLSASLLLAACGGKGDDPAAAGGPPAMPPLPVEVAKVEARSLVSGLSTVGTLRADETVVMRPEIAGRIERIHFEEGGQVRAGQPLFTLDGSLARAALNEARANLAIAQSANSRAERLNAERLIAGADYDRTRAQVVVEQARVASAQASLGKLTLHAPFSGQAGLRNIAVGDVVNAGQDLVTIVRLDPMEIDFSIPESALGQIESGQTVTVGVDAFPGTLFTGIVVAIDPVVDSQSRSAHLRARLDNPDGRLRPGQFAQLTLETGSRDATALLIPEQALLQDGQVRFVYTVHDGKARRTPVVTGRREPGLIEVTSGLKAGDTVITAGQTKPMMFDGAAVAPLPAEGDEAAKSPPATGEAKAAAAPAEEGEPVASKQ